MFSILIREKITLTTNNYSPFDQPKTGLKKLLKINSSTY